ncbi:MAG: excinuclease ABC subunit UvrA [Clostridia bacterium]|nr:excinuclease ABC subunit UvrA [Clostridia bacterium]
MKKYIRIRGARENNLKNIDVDVPHDSLTVFTGLSGSGKSSLAFDTIYAEGKRRYVESLSSYARMFLGQANKPDVESIDGLSPAISIDQKTTSHNPRSTVGTVTEIYDYLRLLFAKAGSPYCPKCGKPVTQQTIDQIIDTVLLYGEGARLTILAPIARGKKGEYKKELANLAKQGYARVKIDGEMRMLGEEEIILDKQVKHNISVSVDRLVLKDGVEKRLTDSVETALRLADGIVIIDNNGEETLFNTKYACADCGVSLPEIEPKLFSFNSPFGACPECSGLGIKQVIDPKLLYGDGSKSLREGAITVTGWNFDSAKTTLQMFTALSEKYGFSLDTPFRDLPEKIRNILLYGDDSEVKITVGSDNFSYSWKRKYEGVITNLERRYRTSGSESAKREIEKYIREMPCSVCGGRRLRPEALSVKIGGKNIHELCVMQVTDLLEFLSGVTLGVSQTIIATPILKEIKARLRFLVNVGLEYLTLSRGANTLSGGEAQRIRLATQIGSGLTGVVYILDEPSIGLHQRDNVRLINTLKKLRDLGNTLVVVEHDEETMREADYIVDIGPGAGVHGGEVVAIGTPDEVALCKNSVTGDFLSGRRSIAVPDIRRDWDKSIIIRGARQNNLKNIDVEIPLGVLTAVTGVSGSGKSSIVNQILYPAISNYANGSRLVEGEYDRIDGKEYIDKVICIDQSPIGRTPRSNPATYTGAFTHIRELFAKTPDAMERGYGAGRFSFNVKGGRCEACEGDGIRKIEMHFLSDVYVPCEVCEGKRYNRETLQVKYKGKNIYDVLEMTVEEACGFFENQQSIYSKIKTLYDVGLGYIKLGQSATTLSGGEAQRVKLATELSKRPTNRTLYVLDEPTTGLHSADVEKLISILGRLVGSGNTVVVIEHNLDVIKTADWIIDVGPEGGDKGGRIIASGTPEIIARSEISHTGAFLKKILNKEEESL